MENYFSFGSYNKDIKDRKPSSPIRFKMSKNSDMDEGLTTRGVLIESNLPKY
jgi:hypothetical protein